MEKEFNEVDLLNKLKSDIFDKYYINRDNTSYFNEFRELLRYFKDNIPSEDYEKILVKINAINSEKSIYKYFQFISELVFGKHLLLNFNNTFKSEVKLLTDRDTDVDFQIEYDKITFNIEIKCPHFERKDILNKDNDSLKIHIMNRMKNKEEYDSLLEDVIKDIGQPILDKSGYTQIKEGWLEDNKIKRFLISSQSKFIDWNINNLNVVIIALDSPKDLAEWNLYLTNISTGFLYSNSYFPHNKFDKVDIIILSNLISGHRDLKELDKFNCWEVENYFNYFFINPFSIRNKEINKEYANTIYEKIKNNQEILVCKEKEIYLMEILENIYNNYPRVNGATEKEMISMAIDEVYAKKDLYTQIVGNIYEIKHRNNIPNSELIKAYSLLDEVIPNRNYEFGEFRNKSLEKMGISEYNEAVEFNVFAEYVHKIFEKMISEK